jgi:hypothetical protein
MNYITIAGETHSIFVEVHDYMPQADPSCPDLKHHAALVMEKGGQDLQSHILRNGRLKGKELQDAAKVAITCVGAIHENKMVWTEIKTSNFVTTADADTTTGQGRPKKTSGKDSTIKGIDLESAVSHSNPPIDFTAYAPPPPNSLWNSCVAAKPRCLWTIALTCGPWGCCCTRWRQAHHTFTRTMTMSILQ